MLTQKELWRLIGYLAGHCEISIVDGSVSIPSDAPQWAKDGLKFIAEHPEVLPNIKGGDLQ